MSQTREEALKAAFESMDRFINSMGVERDIPQFIELMACNHRTLQNNFTKLCFAWIQDLAARDESKPGRNGFDPRNGSAVKAAKKIMSAVDKYDLMLPTI